MKFLIQVKAMKYLLDNSFSHVVTETEGIKLTIRVVIVRVVRSPEGRKQVWEDWSFNVSLAFVAAWSSPVLFQQLISLLDNVQGFLNPLFIEGTEHKHCPDNDFAKHVIYRWVCILAEQLVSFFVLIVDQQLEGLFGRNNLLFKDFMRFLFVLWLWEWSRLRRLVRDRDRVLE